jgi:predicted TIM-barrel fold metal-dependent hydrolase
MIKLDAPLVDSHFHIWRRDLPLTDTAWHKSPGDATVERLLETLDAHGVTFGVVAAASLHGLYNDYVRAALKRHRRLRATANVTHQTDIYQLERMRDDGFVGVRFLRSVLDDPPDLRSGEYRLLLRRVADLGWHVHLTDRKERLADTIAAVEASGATLVLDHLALAHTPEGVNGATFRAVLAAVERGQTWVKLSGGFRFSPRSAAKQYVDALVRLTGGERLVWGSDWPFAGHEGTVTYADTLAMLEEWIPDPATRRIVGGLSPLKLYFA